MVLPTDNLPRAQELLERSGLARMMAQGAQAVPVVHVTAVLGTGEILTVLDQRVNIAFTRESDALTGGVRTS